jgi:hypothetical protein
MTQTADVRGQGNVTVQIVGEQNQVSVAGAAALRLTMYPRRRREGARPVCSAPTRNLSTWSAGNRSLLS